MSEPKWTAGLVYGGPFGRDLWTGICILSDRWEEVAPGSARLIGGVSMDRENMADEEAHANGHLWAASPDLYAACGPLADADPDNPPFGVSVDDWRAAVHAARTARAKARGETT